MNPDWRARYELAVEAAEQAVPVAPGKTLRNRTPNNGEVPRGAPEEGVGAAKEGCRAGDQTIRLLLRREATVVFVR